MREGWQQPPLTGSREAFGPDGHVLTMRQLEMRHIEIALARYDGCASEAARRLGIGRSTLYRKLLEAGVSVRFP